MVLSRHDSTELTPPVQFHSIFFSSTERESDSPNKKKSCVNLVKRIDEQQLFTFCSSQHPPQLPPYPLHFFFNVAHGNQAIGSLFTKPLLLFS